MSSIRDWLGQELVVPSLGLTKGKLYDSVVDLMVERVNSIISTATALR